MLIRRSSNGRWKGAVGICAYALSSAAAPAFADKLSDLYELRVACETGERDACYMLGHAYETRDDLWGEPVRGDLVRRDDSAAMRYFRKACDMGEGKGCRRLGRMYEFGKGADKDNIEALRFYLRACDRSEKQLCADLSELLER